MDLFNVTPSMETMHDKPRDATHAEVGAYLRWLAHRAGLDTSGEMSWSPQGATFGRCLKAGVWHHDEAKRIPPEYPAGSYSVPMPGFGRQPHVTCDILNEDGTTARTITLPRDAKGKLPFTKDQAREWCALPKPARRTAARKPVERVEPVSAPVEAPEPVIPSGAPIPAPVAATPADSALADRVAALEATLQRMGLAISPAVPAAANDDAHAPRRTPAERRAIERAWRTRCDARARRDLDVRALEAANAYCRKLVLRAEAEESRAKVAAIDRDATQERASMWQKAAAEETTRALIAERTAAEASARADDLARRLWNAEQHAAGADNRVARMVRAASDYRRTARRAVEDVRASRAEARALSSRLADAQRRAAAATPRPADPAPTDSAMALAFAAAGRR